MLSAQLNQSLAEEVALCYHDPLRFVMLAFPWGQPGSLQNETGPDDNQKEFLLSLGEEVRKRNFDGATPVMPVRMAETSGHGTGKSAMGAWITWWILSTRPHSIGTITAGTYTQLEEKTWAAVRGWGRQCLTAPWFDIQAKGIYSKKSPDTWKVIAQTCKEENAQSFAGQHAKGSTSWYLFDEACHDDKTEVMSKRGWLAFNAVKPKDFLLTPQGWQRPIALHSSRSSGRMLAVSKRGLSLCVTPNHDMYGISQKGVAKKVKANAISESGILAPRTVAWSAPDRNISDDELRLSAWYYSEGHLMRNRYKCKKRKQVAPPYWGFGITNKIDHGISELLDRLGVNWGKNGISWLVYDRHRAAKYAEEGIGCLEKGLPEWMFSLSQRQMGVFLDTYALGDGYVKNKKRVLYTSSLRLANGLHALAVLAGFNSSLTRRALRGKTNWVKDHWATSTCDGWVITLSETGAGVTLLRSHFKPIEYSGMVYCATVPAGLLLTRRNGTVIWSGNSEVPDKIYETAEGGLTDGEPMFFAWGQPVRNTGEFYKICFGDKAERWNHRRVDSRTSRFTNKELVAQWIKDYGEQSDFVKVRVFGLPPSASELQYIDSGRVSLAVKREVIALPDDPLIAGFDVSGGGKAWNVIRFRRGLDGRPAGMEPIRISGESDPERSKRVGICAELLSDRRSGKQLSAMFVDSAFGAVIVSRLRALGFSNVYEVNFGGESPDMHCLNMRAYMWQKAKEHCLLGSLPKDENLPESHRLTHQLCLPGYHINNSGKLVMESKQSIAERGEASPDDADAFCLTYAQPVAPRSSEMKAKTAKRVWG